MNEKIQQIHMGRLIQMLSHQLKRQNTPVTVALDETGLTNIQKHVLKFILLETLHKEVFQKDIEEEFQIRKSTATGILQLMEKNGFIRRESVARDARLKRILPTPAAEALRPQILAHITASEARLTQNISEQDILTCKRVLYQMLLNISENHKNQEEHIS